VNVLIESEKNMEFHFINKGIENEWGKLHAFYGSFSSSGGFSQSFAAYDKGIYFHGVNQKRGTFVHKKDVMLKIELISKNFLNIRHLVSNNSIQEYLEIYICLDQDYYRESIQNLISWYSWVLSSREDDIEGFNRFTHEIDSLSKKYNIISDRINLNTIEISDFFLRTDENLVFGRDREKGDLLIYYAKLGSMPLNFIIEYDKFHKFTIEKNIDKKELFLISNANEKNSTNIWTGYSLTGKVGASIANKSKPTKSYFECFLANPTDEGEIVIHLKNNANVLLDLEHLQISSSFSFIKLPIRYYGILKELYSDEIGDLL